MNSLTSSSALWTSSRCLANFVTLRWQKMQKYSFDFRPDTGTIMFVSSELVFGLITIFQGVLSFTFDVGCVSQLSRWTNETCVFDDSTVDTVSVSQFKISRSMVSSFEPSMCRYEFLLSWNNRMAFTNTYKIQMSHDRQYAFVNHLFHCRHYNSYHQIQWSCDLTYLLGHTILFIWHKRKEWFTSTYRTCDSSWIHIQRP